MAVLRLTSDNLAFVKRELRRAFPQIKSSHLSEGLAATLGYNTHAALITKTKDAASLMTVRSLDLDRWHKRLTELGCSSENGPLIKIARAIDLPDPCWREIPKRDLASNNAWFRYCCLNDIPNVLLNPRQKYTRLRWDCVSTSGSGDEGIRGESGRPLMRSLFSTFQEYARLDPGRPIFEGSSFVGEIEGLVLDTARDLADAFFLALFNASRESKTEAVGVAA